MRAHDGIGADAILAACARDRSVEILVANAGVAIHAPLMEMTDEQWVLVLGVTSWASFG